MPNSDLQAHLRRGRSVLNDQIASLLLEVEVLDVQRAAVLCRMRLEQSKHVLNHSIFFRNKPVRDVRF